MTNENAVKVKYDERNYLSKIMEYVQFLGRQVLPFQGEFGNDNFTQLLIFRGKDDSHIAKRLLAPTNRQFKKYTHDEFQNELLDIMAKHFLSDKLAHIHASPFYALMADEYTDISNKEHVSICVRWIDPKGLSVYEDFLGFYEVKNRKSETIFNAIKDVLLRLQLRLSKLRGQTYDGASNIMGRKSGVAAKIKECQKKVLETSCHGHSLNLAVKDVTSQSTTLKDTIGTVGEICILVKFSPKRKKLLGEIQENINGETDEVEKHNKATSLDKLCPTKWTVCAKCYTKIMETYDSFLELLEMCLKEGGLNPIQDGGGGRIPPPPRGFS